MAEPTFANEVVANIFGVEEGRPGILCRRSVYTLLKAEIT